MKKNSHNPPTPIDRCQQCGTCCRNGGPALHGRDLTLLKNGGLKPHELITIRAGETVLLPLTGQPETLTRELIKISGLGDSWACRFLDRTRNTCKIYSARPLECRLLKCWAPNDLLAVISRDPLVRSDIITPEDPLNKFIDLHERECPGLKVNELLNDFSQARNASDRLGAMAALEDLVNRDISLRSAARQEINLPVDLEIFLFGRPLFIILNQHGFQIHEDIHGLHLRRTQEAVLSEHQQ